MRTLFVANALLAACTVAHESEPATGTTTQGLEAYNGEQLNGEQLNGEQLNGEQLNGEQLNGPNTGAFSLYSQLSSFTLADGTPFDTIDLTASQFTGTIGGTTYAGPQMIGAQFQSRRGDSSWVTMHIAASQAPVAGTYWMYTLEYLGNGGGNDWHPICHDNNGPLRAIAFNGTWDHTWGTSTGGSYDNSDPDKFTVACEKVGALAKCVIDGYEPWSSVNGVSLLDYHLACARLLRADYCGDGTSYTTNGRLLNLYDSLGVQPDTDAWGIEAEWDSHGARCLTTHRRASQTVTCNDEKIDPTCGDPTHFQSGTLLMDELP